MRVKYYYSVGPVSFAELQRLKSIGTIHDQTWVIEEGAEAKWKPLHSLLGNHDHGGSTMKGQVLDFSIQANSGWISGTDGGRYSFSGAEWKGQGAPARGAAVDFEVDGNQARAVYTALGSTAPGSKSKTAAGLLALFLGGLGIHKFYLGFTGPGLVYLLVNTIGFAVTWIVLFIPNLILGVMSLIEGIIYLTNSDEEFEQEYVVQKKQWF